MSSEKYIGLDVHQATISAAVVDSQGKVVMESILETKASTLLEFLAGLIRQLVEHRASAITQCWRCCSVVVFADRNSLALLRMVGCTATYILNALS